MASKDKRRTDARVPVNSEPFWFTSAVLSAADTGVDNVLKDFRLQDGTFMILAAGVEIMEAFDGSASILVGNGTMALPAVGTVSAVDADQFLISADVTEATIGYYAQSGSQFATDLGAGKQTVVTGADTTVPVLYANITASSPTVGKARIHFLMTRIPVASPAY
jgi:hypothetical protein